MAMRSSHSKREEENEDIQPEKHWTKPSKISEMKRRPDKHEVEVHREINALDMILSAKLLCGSYPTKAAGLKIVASYIVDDVVQESPGKRLEQYREKIRREREQTELGKGSQNVAKECQKKMTLDSLVDNLNLG